MEFAFENAQQKQQGLQTPAQPQQDSVGRNTFRDLGPAPNQRRDEHD